MFYEFYCGKCKTRVALRRPMANASVPVACETCGAILQRVYSAPGIIMHESMVGYLNKAAEGRETVPGKTPEQTRRSATAYANEIRRRHDR